MYVSLHRHIKKKFNMTNSQPDQLQQKSNQCHNQQRKAPVLKCKYMASTLKQLKSNTSAQKITLHATKWPSLQPFHRFILDNPQMPVNKLKPVFCKKKAHQINSRQWEQKVGWRRNVAMNL